MTVGKSGEEIISCGGVRGLYLTVGWEERFDPAANCSVLAVTGVSMASAETVGTFTVGGTIAADDNIICRLAANAHFADIAEVGVPADVFGEYPYSSADIVHNVDGSKTVTLTVQLSGVCSDGGSWYADGRTAVELTDIARVSAVQAASGDIGAALPITITAAASEFTHTLRYAFAGETGIIATVTDRAHIRWSPPMELCALLPDSTSAPCVVYCDTYSGDVLQGTSRCTVSLFVPATVGVGLQDGWLQVAPDNSGTAAEGLTGYIQGYSRAAVTVDETKIDLSNAYGAVPAGFVMELYGHTYTDTFTTDVLTMHGQQILHCALTDSRGRRVAENVELTVLPYNLPVIGDVTIMRCDAAGAADDMGDSVLVGASVTVSSLDGQNSAVLQARLRSMDGTWSEATTLENGSTAVLWNGTVRSGSTYEVELMAEDVPGNTATLTVVVPTANVFFHGRDGGCGAAFGKYADTDGVLDVAWDLSVDGALRVGGRSLGAWLYPVGAVFSCVGEADPAALYGGIWKQLEADGDVNRWLRESV